MTSATADTARHAYGPYGHLLQCRHASGPTASVPFSSDNTIARDIYFVRLDTMHILLLKARAALPAALTLCCMHGDMALPLASHVQHAEAQTESGHFILQAHEMSQKCLWHMRM